MVKTDQTLSRITVSLGQPVVVTGSKQTPSSPSELFCRQLQPMVRHAPGIGRTAEFPKNLIANQILRREITRLALCISGFLASPAKAKRRSDVVEWFQRLRKAARRTFFPCEWAKGWQGGSTLRIAMLKSQRQLRGRRVERR